MAKKWGVWITHDIDHICVREHYLRDLFLLRIMAVSAIEVFRGRKSMMDHARFKLGLFRPDNWNNFDELMAVESKYRIPSTWFFAVNRGKSLSYTLDEITPIVKSLNANGFDLGLHGQAYEGEVEIRKEFELFRKVVGEKPKGVRMHYLQMNLKTLEDFSDIYCYDSSVYDPKGRPPKKSLHLVEIPIHIMDTYLFSPLKMNKTLKQAQEYTKKMLARTKKKGGVLVFDLHPHHYCDSFPRHKEYIDWLFIHLKKNRIKKYGVMEILRQYNV